MSTHDYVIDNQSASAFRADLNSVLNAIVTQNSNATAPATTYANMLWYDIAAHQIKKRNEANSAWVTLGTIDETAGTFTPSGGAAIASQAEAEAGTDNTKMMTPLRVAQAIDAQVVFPAPTTSQVLAATAGASAGAVGTYAFAYSAAAADTGFGATLAGSSLQPAGVASNGAALRGAVSVSALAGTWRCMGISDYTLISGADPDYFGMTLWLRIA